MEGWRDGEKVVGDSSSGRGMKVRWWSGRGTEGQRKGRKSVRLRVSPLISQSPLQIRAVMSRPTVRGQGSGLTDVGGGRSVIPLGGRRKEASLLLALSQGQPANTPPLP